ncbi:MAG: protein kinase [Elusimicrobia bacterium]|nr:protein kinase [Elusimicrobiota bacterium]
MRPTLRGRAFAAFFSALLSTGARAAPPSGLTPDQESVIGEFTTEISKIPPDLYGNFKGLDDFIRTNPDPEMAGLHGNQQFQKAIAILAGLGRARAERGAGESPSGGAAGSDGRSRSEEEYFRLLGASLRGQSWPYVEGAKRAYRRKDFRSALRDYEEAIRRNPADKEAMLGYGHSANELGDYLLAVMAARQLLERDPSDAEALGLYHFASGRTPTVSLPSSLFQVGAGAEEAAADAPGALRPAAVAGGQGVSGSLAQPADPAAASAAERSAQITREAATALRMKDYPTAHDLAGKAIGLNAGNAQALNFRAIASSRMRRYAEAVADASAAVALAPGNGPALQTRSWAFSKQNRYLEALRDADETLAIEPNNPFAYQNKAFALAGLKDRDGALSALRRSADLDPRFLNRYERAVQLPQSEDLTLLFDDEGVSGGTAAAFASPAPRARRFARLAGLSAIGGILIALGVLHIVSAGWRQKVGVTIRRALSGRAPAPQAAPVAGGAGSAFWTQYEVVKEIGLGGMGVVYEAKDRSLERRVAVKKMRDEIRVDSHERARFVNEAKLVAQLRHPNIVDIYAIVEESQEVYLVFEFVEGRTLRDQIKSDGPLSLEAARGVLGAVSDAVEHAHAHHIVHRDLKPSNVMVTSDGRIKVMDFGVARQAKDSITKMSMTNSVVGTPAYMSPEQEQGTVRRESDVYALGVCLYEMLTGQLPFTGGGAAMLLKKLNGKHIPPSQQNPSLPRILDEIIAKALVADPEQRYHTPGELVRALDSALAQRA